MNSENFCYWLQGVFEIANLQELNTKQTLIVKEHLKLVVNKVTPEHCADEDVPKKRQYLTTSVSGVSAAGLC